SSELRPELFSSARPRRTATRGPPATQPAPEFCGLGGARPENGTARRTTRTARGRRARMARKAGLAAPRLIRQERRDPDQRRIPVDGDLVGGKRVDVIHAPEPPTKTRRQVAH